MAAQGPRSGQRVHPGAGAPSGQARPRPAQSRHGGKPPGATAGDTRGNEAPRQRRTARRRRQSRQRRLRGNGSPAHRRTTTSAAGARQRSRPGTSRRPRQSRAAIESPASSTTTAAIGDSRNRSSVRADDAGPLQEQVRQQRRAGLHRIARRDRSRRLRASTSSSMKKLPVVVRASRVRIACAASAMISGLRIRSRLARRAGNHRDRRGRDDRARPQRVDGDAVAAEFLGHPEHAHAHPVLGHRVGDVSARTISRRG